jgi:Protein of unknown function (DUF1569)
MHVVLERVVSQMSDEVRSLNAETAQLHPGGKTHVWSVQQVVEHLVLGYRMTTSALQGRLDKGRLSRSRSRTYLQWLLQVMLLSFGRLPRGAPALDEVTPVEGIFPAMSGVQLTELLRQELEAMDVTLDACWRKFGMERVAAHPWLGSLRVDQWRRFHAIHGLHHVQQVRAVLAQVVPTPVPIRINIGRLAKEPKVPAERPVAQKNAI